MNLLESKTVKANERVDVLCRLAFIYYDSNDSLGLHYAQLALSEGIRLKYQAGIKYALTLSGIGHMTTGNYDLAINYLERSRSMIVPNTDTIDIYSLILEGNIERNISKYDSANYFYEKAIEIASSTNGWRWISMLRKNVSILNSLQWKNEEALEQARLALNAASKVNYPGTKLEALSAMGRAYLNLFEYDSAAYCFEQLCSSGSSTNYFNRIRCHLHWSEFEFKKSNYSKALVHCYDALKLTEQYAYPPQVAEIYEKLGEIYSALNQYEFASKYLFEALKVCSKYKLRDREATVLADLAWINKDLKNFQAALNFLNQSQNIYESIGSEFGISYCKNIRGLVYLLQEKYDSALAELEESKRLRENINHTYGVAASISNIGLVYEAQGDLKGAYEFQLEAVRLEEKVSNKQSLGISYNDLAGLSLKLNMLDKCYEYLTIARRMADETGSKLLLVNNYKIFAEYAAKKGNFKEAYNYQQKFQELNDSVYTTSSRAKLAEMEALYQLEQRDQQIKLLNQEKKLSEQELDIQRAQIKIQYIVIGFGALGLLLLILLVWNFYQSNSKIRKANNEIIEQKEEIQAQSEELVEANQTIAQINRDLEQTVESRTVELKQAYKELDTFFYRSSHDFRRPLTTFLGLAEVAKITVKDSSALELFEKVSETATTLDKMLVKLQSISDVGLNELVFKEVSIQDIFNVVCDQYRDLIQSKQIDISFESDNQDLFRSYPVLLKVIFENLIENSIHFSVPNNPIVKVKSECIGATINLIFSDNGQGIEEEYQNRVFDMYFRANHQSKGNGLGLYIVQKAVSKLRGHISLVSKKNEGTIFFVSLPMS